jgi:hypothetical protein
MRGIIDAAIPPAPPPSLDAAAALDTGERDPAWAF